MNLEEALKVAQDLREHHATFDIQPDEDVEHLAEFDRLKVTAAEGMAEAFENHRCGCQNQELRAALAAWKAGSK